MKKRRKYFLLFLFLLLTNLSKSQVYNGGERWFFGLNAGINRLFGDVSPQNNVIFANPITEDFYKNRNLSVSVFFGKEITPFWFARINCNYGNLQTTNYSLNLKSKISHVHEIALLHTIDIFGFFPHERRLANWDLNIFLGFGLLGFQSKLFDIETNELLNVEPLVLQNKKTAFQYNFALSFGLGFSYELDWGFKFNFATLYRIINNDLFDAWKNTKKAVDGYAFLQVGFAYVFNFKHSTKSRVKENYPLTKNSPNYKYKKHKLKYGYAPINKNKKNR